MKRVAILMAALVFALAFVAGCESPKEQGGMGKVKGRAYKPAEGLTVYLYKPGQDLRGPPFAQVGPLGVGGDYSFDLPAGEYILVARQRLSGEESGPVKSGDVKSDPVSVTPFTT